MSPDAPFRFAVLAILCLTAVIVGYHRLQAAKTGERFSRSEEGLLLAVSLRLAGLCMWIGTFAYLVRPHSMAWAAVPLPIWLRWIGAGAGAFFIGLIYWTLTSLGKNLTDTVATRKNATLVTTGPYCWVRHPFYISAGLLILSVTLLTADWFLGLSGLIVITLLVLRTPKEEQKLVERFGDQYRSYMATTGQFWPKLWSAKR